jgi:hypothetical protein
MARTAIVTSQPEVACDICERRLLRGERAESFLEGSRPHLVCELCRDRARQAGWVRAGDLGAGPVESYSSEGRSLTLFERLRRRRSAREDDANRSTRSIA